LAKLRGMSSSEKTALDNIERLARETCGTKTNDAVRALVDDLNDASSRIGTGGPTFAAEARRLSVATVRRLMREAAECIIDATKSCGVAYSSDLESLLRSLFEDFIKSDSELVLSYVMQQKLMLGGMQSPETQFNAFLQQAWLEGRHDGTALIGHFTAQLKSERDKKAKDQTSRWFERGVVAILSVLGTLLVQFVAKFFHL
jgi:histone H3/H4